MDKKGENNLATNAFAQLESVFANISDGVAVFDSEGKLNLKNSAILRMHDLNEEEFEPRQLRKYDDLFRLEDFHGNRIEQKDWPIARCLRGEQVLNLECVVVNLKTDRKWHACYSGTTITNEDGSIKEVVVTVRDVTKLHRSQKALRSSEKNFQLAISGSRAVFIIQDRQLRIQWIANPAESWANKNLIGKTDYDIIEDKDEAEKLTKLKKKAMKLRHRVTDVVVLHSGDKRYVFDMLVEPHYDEWGNIVGVVCVAIDITAQQENERRLEEITQTLEHMVEERTVLAEQRSRQLQALTTQLTRVEQEERRKLVKIIHDNLQQLIVAAKFKVCDVERRIEDEDLKRKISEAISLMDESVKVGRSLSMDVSPPILFEAELPTALEWLSDHIRGTNNLNVEVESSGDFSQISQELKIFLFTAVKELLFNVSKHANTDKAEIVLSISNEFVHCSVVDAGDGFDIDQIRQKAARDTFGLFSIEERSSFLGGKFVVESKIGDGTKITISVPVKNAVESKKPDRGKRKSKPEKKSGKQGKSEKCKKSDKQIKVLVVDDHAMVRQGIVSFLSQHDEIELCGQAGDGFEAIRMCEQLGPDVVLMDISMPGLSGIEATRQICNKCDGIAVIVLSVHEDTSIAAAAMEAGAHDYVTKNRSFDEMLEIIKMSYLEVSEDKAES